MTLSCLPTNQSACKQPARGAQTLPPTGLSLFANLLWYIFFFIIIKRGETNNIFVNVSIEEDVAYAASCFYTNTHGRPMQTAITGMCRSTWNSNLNRLTRKVICHELWHQSVSSVRNNLPHQGEKNKNKKIFLQKTQMSSCRIKSNTGERQQSPSKYIPHDLSFCSV